MVAKMPMPEAMQSARIVSVELAILAVWR